MSYKDKTNEVLLRVYRERGLDYTLEMSWKLMESNYNVKKQGVGIVFGEICETVLEIMTLEYIKKNKLQDSWFYSKGLILRDIETMSNEFYTELDFVVFSPQRIFLFECKSYKGAKVIKNKGELKRSRAEGVNIFDQHKLHTQVFIKIFNAFRSKDSSTRLAYQMAAFSYAEGSLKDAREDKWKEMMPILEVDTLYSLYDTASKAPSVWRMKDVRRAVEILERSKKANAAKHLDYVTRLRNSRK